MRSQLTRTIFRRLLSNEPLLFCHHRPSNSKPSAARYLSASYLRSPPRDCYPNGVQKRTLFGFSSKPARVPKEPVLDPGIRPFLDMIAVEKLQHRAPPRKDLVKGWRTFYGYKKDTMEPLLGFQAEHTRRGFRYLMKDRGAGWGAIGGTDAKHPEELTLLDLRNAASTLGRMPNDYTEYHNLLARELYAEIVRVREDFDLYDLKKCIWTLCGTGHSSDARALLRSDFLDVPDLFVPDKANIGLLQPLHHQIMSGFAKEGNEEELLKTYETASAEGLRYGPATQNILVSFYADMNNIEKAREWYDRPYDTGVTRPVDPKTISKLLELCVRNNELQWCSSIFRKLLQSEPSKPVWDIIFQWAAGALGKGVEDVERMMNIMKEVNGRKTKNPVGPDIETINGLVRLAMSQNDPYLAERYLALGLKHGIQPDAETLILQLSYRVSAGDLTGAQVVYQNLQSEEVIQNADLPAINQYIQALCAVETPNYNLITSICSDLEERKARLEHSTVSAVGLLHAKRGEILDLLDLLTSQTYLYSIADADRVRDVLYAYAMDPTTKTARSWDTYNVFRSVFGDTDLSIRTNMMNEFFRRRRSDMALHTFGHMRALDRVDRRPTLSTYVQCFEGIASCADLEALETVHNMLKLDMRIEPNTQLYNALMLAYTACEDSDRAVEFWDDITNSREGPSYRSLEIVFRACRRKPFGDKIAREIWNKMRRMEIEVTKDVYVAYISALAGQTKLAEAQRLIETSIKDLGFKPDVQILGTVYNAVPSQHRKDRVEAWAKDLWPEAWADLMKLGRFKAKEGHTILKMPPLAYKA